MIMMGFWDAFEPHEIVILLLYFVPNICSFVPICNCNGNCQRVSNAIASPLLKSHVHWIYLPMYPFPFWFLIFEYWFVFVIDYWLFRPFFLFLFFLFVQKSFFFFCMIIWVVLWSMYQFPFWFLIFDYSGHFNFFSFLFSFYLSKSLFFFCDNFVVEGQHFGVRSELVQIWLFYGQNWFKFRL